MLSKKIKTAILVILGLIIVLFAVALITAPSQPGSPASPVSQNQNENEQQPATARDNGTVDNPPPPPVFQTVEKRYEVLAVKEGDTYQVRDLADNKELDLFLPSDANITAGKRESIKAGTILTVQRFMELSNGVVATELSISTVE